LNNNVPVHVIQALLGHAGLDTVMVYAKLYPSTLIEEYRKAVRATYSDFHGPDSLRAPTIEEWQRFSAASNLRDMGTHLCALPTGDHCTRGLVCLGCSHAQPKCSAAPRSSSGCSPVTSARLRGRARPASPPARLQRASWRSGASPVRCAAPTSSPTTSLPRWRPSPDVRADESAGQLAARELRSNASTARRAEELSVDAAAALEGVA